MAVWTVKGGRHGEREERCLELGVVGGGWEQIQDDRNHRRWTRIGFLRLSSGPRRRLPACPRRHAIRGFFEDWWGAYDDLAQEVEAILDLGNGVVFSVVTQRGRPAGSTGEVHLRAARVALTVEGLIERVTAYGDIDEARAAAERLAEERG
jgi:ketosteroid isomerase-like protein